MGNDALIGLAVITVILFGGIFIRGICERLVFRQRIKLFERARDLLACENLTKAERRFVNFVLDKYDSFRAGWIMPRILIRAMMRKVRNEALPHSQPDRTLCLVVPFMLSALVANPIALLATAFLIPPFLLTAAVRQHEGPKAAMRDAAWEVGPAGWNGKLAH